MKLNDPKFKQNIYQVPEGYFDKLNSNIMKRVENPVAHEEAAWYQLPLFRLSMAAAVLALAVAGGWFWQGNDSSETEEIYAAVLLDEIPTSDIETYLMNTDLSAIEVSEIIQEENLELDFTNDDSSLEDQLLELDLELSDFEEIL